MTVIIKDGELVVTDEEVDMNQVKRNAKKIKETTYPARISINRQGVINVSYNSGQELDMAKPKIKALPGIVYVTASGKSLDAYPKGSYF